MKFNLSFLVNIVLMLFVIISDNAVAGGVGLGATRIIYNESSTQSSLPVTNSDMHERYLVQAWVEDSSGKKITDFVVTPPLFVAAPKSENSLRIVYLGTPLPKDREVVYWMNVKAIPAVDSNTIKDKNTLQLAILSRIKLFMRPNGLSMSELEAPEHLRFNQNGGKLTIYNPTPYYQTLVNISVGGKKLTNSMVPPLGQLTIELPPKCAGEIRFQTVNDYGAVTPQQNGKVG